MSEKPAPKKRGRKPILDPELVAAALAELQGNVMAVAKRFGVHRSSVQELIGKRPALQAICRDAREGMKDNAESALYRAVITGEAWAVCFFLKTQAKDRGYTEKVEIDGRTRATLELVEEIVDGDGNTPPDGPTPPVAG